jgi:hypothetical protein
VQRICILILVAFLFGCASTTIKKNLTLVKDSHYPRWIKSDKMTSDQTSGIAFLGENKQDGKVFLLADDIGMIRHLAIKNDTDFTISNVILAPKVQAYLDTFPKEDFEEIVYDKLENQVYLSIEGDNPDPKKFVGIFNIRFKNDNTFSDTITSITKLYFQPYSLFLKYVENNIGYEGLAVDGNYFYLGLEGFEDDGVFADSTFLFIADKKTKKIIKQINSKPLDIHTICGLYSDKNYSLYGVDRNNKKIFHINFDKNLNITDYGLAKIPTNIPGYPNYDYVASLESITMDNQMNFYLTDDPWKRFFIPSQEILNKLDSSTVNNFKKFVPVIYKFQIKYN